MSSCANLELSLKQIIRKRLLITCCIADSDLACLPRLPSCTSGQLVKTFDIGSKQLHLKKDRTVWVSRYYEFIQIFNVFSSERHSIYFEHCLLSKAITSKFEPTKEAQIMLGMTSACSYANQQAKQHGVGGRTNKIWKSLKTFPNLHQLENL